MKNSLVVIALGIWAIASLAMAEVNTNKAFEFRLYGLAEQFEWKESVNDQELLKESGPLFGIGGEFGVRLDESLWLEGRGELFFGEVDYDGAIQTESGDLIPYKSTTTYGGLKVEGDIAFKAPLDRDVYVKPYVGLGVRAWERTLDSELSDEYIGDYGYTEDWLTFYGIVGFGGGIAISKDAELYGRIEGRLPFRNSMTADLSNLGGPSDVELEPGKRASIYIEGGINITPITVSVFVETLEFSESALDDKYEAAFQPDSSSTMIGAKFGFTF